MDRTMVMIVGTQKGGTSWLWRTLTDCPTVSAGFTKEMHVFDALHVDTFSGYRRMILREAHTALRSDPRTSTQRQTDAIRRAGFLYDPGQYFDYFAGLLEDARVAVDATPTYMGLPERVLRYIKEEFESRGVRVAPIILLREPVNRLGSDIRFKHRRAGESIPSADLDQTLHAHGRDGVNNYGRICSDYRAAVGRLGAVFGDDVLALMYEEFFETAETDRVARFVGLEHLPADFGEQVNADQSAPARLDPGDYPGLVAVFRDQYEFARERFGADLVSRYWLAE